MHLRIRCEFLSWHRKRARFDGEVIVRTVVVQKHITGSASLGRYSEEPRANEGKLDCSAIVANADLFKSLRNI